MNFGKFFRNLRMMGRYDFSRVQGVYSYLVWQAQGQPVPAPSCIKQGIVRGYQEASQAQILVETGTFMGDMVEAQRTQFRDVYSVELSEDLWRKAKQRFSKEPNIHLINGDSGKELKTLVPTLKELAIFWLDGHYSGGFTAKAEKECPILEELEAVLASPIRHVILIDDARCFVGKDDYPTREALYAFIRERRPDAQISIAQDVFRIL